MIRVLLLALLSTGCATARLAGDKPFTTPDPGQQRAVMIEPFFETAEWRTTTRTEMATVMGGNPAYGVGMGGGFSRDVAIQRTVADKSMFAKVAALAEEHRQVLAEVQRLRPAWRVTSTSGSLALTGTVALVRVVIHDSELIESNRAIKNFAFGFGLVILPLQLINLTPVEETQRVYGHVQRYQLDGKDLPGRLVRYPTQPDYAVNTANLISLEHSIGLDVSYEEGLLANEAPRDGVLIKGFSERLASAIVALVEEP